MFDQPLISAITPCCGSKDCWALGSRIVQRKMSMKLVKWVVRFPMQDEHETTKNGVGVARPGASAYVECREPKPGTDPGVSQVEPSDRVCGLWAKREVCLGGAGAGGAELRGDMQAGARRGEVVC